MEDELFEQLKQLLKETARAHHAAYRETDGYHPDWPIWYAEHLHGQLGELLGASFTQSELIYLLVLADKEQRLHAPGADWAAYYAHFFIERYT